jgi:hypothetical protein
MIHCTKVGLPTAVRPNWRSTAAVVGLGGQWLSQRGMGGVGRWCGACGGEAGGGRWPEMVACVEVLMKEPVARRTAVPGASHDGQVGRGWRGDVGVLPRRCSFLLGGTPKVVSKGPRTAAAVSKESRNGGGGIKEVPTRGQ